MSDGRSRQDPGTRSVRPEDLSPERRALLAQLLRKRALDEKTRPGPAATTYRMEPDAAGRFDAFPLTDIQQAYWIGRSGDFDMGMVASHAYFEIENAFDVDRLEEAFNKLVERHDMLRAVFLPSGHQRVFESTERYVIRREDLSRASEAERIARLEALRRELSHEVLPSDVWPLFGIVAVRLDGNRTRLLVSLDALILDGWSLSLLFREWAALYDDPNAVLPAIHISFRDYVLAEAKLTDTAAYRKAKAYWTDRIPSLPPGPELPLATSPTALREGRFTRRERTLDEPTWSQLKAKASAIGATSTGLLLAAYAETLSLWSESRRFSVNVPSFNRIPFHEEVDRLIGEIASFGVLEVDMNPEKTFRQRVEEVQQRLWDDLDNRLFSGVRVLREWARQHAQISGSVAPIVFTVAARDREGNDAYPTVAASGLGEVVFSVNQTSQVWIDNHVFEDRGRLCCHWDSVDELFPAGLSETMLDAFMTLLALLARDDSAWNRSSRGLGRRIEEEAAVETAVLDGRTTPIPPALLHELFESRAAEAPGRTAVVAGDRSLTYAELDEASNRWARFLRSEGAVPDTLVAIVTEKGWEQVVAAIAVLKSGAAYLPIDALLPAKRRDAILEDGEVRVVLTQSWLREATYWPPNVTVVAVDSYEVSAWDGGRLERAQAQDNLAFVLYTSGSTGSPKGAMIAHKGLVNAVAETINAFSIGASDVVLGLTALHHDMSVFDLFGVLGAGGMLVLPDRDGRRDPDHWADLIPDHRVTIWNSVPAMMDMFLEYAGDRTGVNASSLRLAFLGGDWIPLTIPGRLAALAPEATVVSVGGPTETTLWNIWYVVAEMDPAWRSIPYGTPIANTGYRIMSDRLVPCPRWVAGEMLVAGPGVARGYWRDAERTEISFIQDPETGERLYRTGDRGRLGPDGNIEFLGRIDFQVKIDGQRIELGDIEATLSRHPAVAAAVVAMSGEGAAKKRLAAFVKTEDGELPGRDELKVFLSEYLPDYMIPSDYVAVKDFPLNPNGKVDRAALRVPDAPAGPTDAGVETRSPGRVENEILALVREVAGVPAVDIRDNLLSLGVNSLDMVRIANSLEDAYGFRPRIDELFRMQTIEALATYYVEKTDQAQKADSSISSAASPEIRELIRSYEVILEPQEREAFRAKRPGVRRELDAAPGVSLEKPPDDATERDRFDLRRSYRTFSLKPISIRDFGRFMSALSQRMLDGKPKFQYGTPGGLNPTQVYLHVKRGRIEGLQGGAYYYHPENHDLKLLTPGVEISRDVHIPFINQPIFDECAFSVFLIADLAAIAPAYGEPSLHFVALEAGIIAHHLEMIGPTYEIGLCQIGSLEFDRIREYFLLRASHILVHSLLGGRIVRGPDGRVVAAPAGKESVAGQVSSLVDRIKDLSEDEIRAVLGGETGTQSGRE